MSPPGRPKGEHRSARREATPASAAALPPAAARWVAAGVRHEVLLRVLPAVRHDLAAPLSVMRMALLLLRRQQQAASGDDAARREERIATLQEQLAVLAGRLNLLRGWGAADPGADGITRAALVERCVALLRPLADLQGLTIEVDPGLQPAPADAVAHGPPEAVQWPGATALRYLVLASLCHLLDRRPAPGAVRIVPDGTDALRLLATARAAADDARAGAGTQEPPGRLRIDAAALRCLAEDLGYGLVLGEDVVHLPLAATPAPPGHNTR